MTSLPNQRIPFSQKGKDWKKDSVEYYCQQADMQYTEDYARIIENYALFNNYIDQTTLQKYTDPLGLDVGQGRDLIQTFNLTFNKIQALKGEELRRPWNYHVIDFSKGAINKIIREKERDLRAYFQSTVGLEIKKMQEEMKIKAQMSVGDLSPRKAQQAMAQVMEELQAEEAEVLNPEQIKNKFKNYKLKLEQTFSKIMREKTNSLKLRHIKNEGWFDMCVAGVEAVLPHIVGGKVKVELVNPAGLAYHKDPEEQFFHKGEYQVYKREATPSSIMDYVSDFLSDKEMKDLEGEVQKLFGTDAKLYSKDGFSPSHFEHLNYKRTPYDQDRYSSSSVPHLGGYGQSNVDEDYLVFYTIFWRSWNRVIFLTSIDEFGDENMEIVPDTFPIPEEAIKSKNKVYGGKTKTVYSWVDELTQLPYEAVYEYVPQVWVGHRIEQDLYVGIRPYEEAGFDKDDPFDYSLPIIGVAINNRNSTIVSPMDRMKPWQNLYFLVMHKWLKLLAQDKGVVQLLNLLMIDKKIGVEKTLQYATDLGYLPYNPLAQTEGAGIVQNMKASEQLNLSNINNIRYYTEILMFIENKIGDAAAVTKPREGQTQSGTNVTDNQRDMFQASTISEPHFTLHDLLWEDVLNEVLRLEKSLIKNKGGEKRRVLFSDEELGVIDVSPDELEGARLGIRIARNGNVVNILDQIKLQAQALIQNDKIQLSTFVEMLSQEDLASMKEIIREMEETMSARQERAEQYQVEAEQKNQQRELDFREDEQAHELEKIDREGMWNLRMKQMDSGEESEDYTKVAKVQHDIEMDKKKAKKEEEELQLKKRAQKEVERKNRADEKIKKMKKPSNTN